MSIYRDGKKVNEEGFLTPASISGYATDLDISGYAMLTTTSGLGNWTSAFRNIYEFAPSSFDTVSGANWAAGATTTASGAIDVSAPSITAVAMISGMGVGFGLVVPPNAGAISQRIIGRNYTSGPTTTFTLYHRNIGGAWSGILVGTVGTTLAYNNTLTSAALTNLPVTAGTYNQFEIGATTSGVVYLADYQLTFG